MKISDIHISAVVDKFTEVFGFNICGFKVCILRKVKEGD